MSLQVIRQTPSGGGGSDFRTWAETHADIVSAWRFDEINAAAGVPDEIASLDLSWATGTPSAFQQTALDTSTTYSVFHDDGDARTTGDPDTHYSAYAQGITTAILLKPNETGPFAFSNLHGWSARGLSVTRDTFYIKTVADGATSAAHGYTFSSGTTYHIVCTWDGTDAKMYVNGGLEETITPTTGGDIDWDTIFMPAGSDAGGTLGFEKYVDDTHVFGTALDATAISTWNGLRA